MSVQGPFYGGIRYGSHGEACAARRADYAALIALGLNYTHSAHLVGVSKRTGKVWRNGRTRTSGRNEQPSLPTGKDWYRRFLCELNDDTHPRYLSFDQRLQISRLRQQGLSMRQIAQHLDVSASTISRELDRNKLDASGTYNPCTAQRATTERRKRARARKCDQPQLWDQILARLRKRWSPEQIAADLRRCFPDNPGMNPCTETIYQAIYIQAKGQLGKELKTLMRQGRTRRKPAALARSPRTRFRDPMIMISQRPASVEDRTIPGHWEGDLIIGANGKSAIGTLVERSTRYAVLLHLPTSHTALALNEAIIRKMSRFPADIARSLTWDQGSEMAHHQHIADALDIDVYFCDPHSPWQRGSNENTNGLLRQYFPKSTDLSIWSQDHLDAVAQELNDRPRKTLDWDTPATRMQHLLTH